MANDKKIKKEKKHFFKDFKTELKKVTWPTGKQLVNNTIAVITIVLITAAIVFILDLGFEMLNKYGINKLKSAISNKNNDQTTVVEETATPEPTDNTGNNQTENGQENNTTTPTASPEVDM